MNNPTTWNNLFSFSPSHQNKQIEEKDLHLLNPPNSSSDSKKALTLDSTVYVFFCGSRCKETYGITEPWFEPLETVVNVTRIIKLTQTGKKTAWKDATKRCWLWQNRGLGAGERANKDAWSCLWFLVFRGRCDMWSSVFLAGIQSVKCDELWLPQAH